MLEQITLYLVYGFTFGVFMSFVFLGAIARKDSWTGRLVSLLVSGFLLALWSETCGYSGLLATPLSQTDPIYHLVKYSGLSLLFAFSVLFCYLIVYKLFQRNAEQVKQNIIGQKREA